MSPHQQTLGIYPVGCTGDKRNQIFLRLNFQRFCFLWLYDTDLIHLIAQGLIQYMKVEQIPLLNQIQIRKKLR